MKPLWIVLFFAFSMPSSLIAQDQAVQRDDKTQRGYWDLFEVGAAFALSGGADEDDVRSPNLALTLMIGGTVSERLRVGGELFGFGGSHSGGNLHVVAIVTPDQNRRFFIRGGAGAGYGDRLPMGFGSSFGVGFDMGRLWGADLAMTATWYTHVRTPGTRHTIVLAIGEYDRP